MSTSSSSSSESSKPQGEENQPVAVEEVQVAEAQEAPVPRTLGALRSPLDERDWRAEAIYPAPRDLALPKSLDLRPFLGPVRDQGSQGSCVAQSATAMKEWQERIQVDLQEPLSPQFVYNLREDPTSEGMYGRDVMRILSQTGICREGMFPYGNLARPEGEPVTEAGNYKIKSYALVSTIDATKTALYKNGPCIGIFPYYETDGVAFWRPNGQLGGGHAVAIVGYNSEGFILRNSWGPFWGDRGYAVYPYADFGMHWEIWTTIDDQSRTLEPLPNNKKGCCTIQ